MATNRSTSRAASAAWTDWYRSAQWKRVRRGFLSEHPLCERCALEGRLTAADTVHHRVPHKGNESLFWDVENLVASCRPCHDQVEQSIERRGFDKRIGTDGCPIDPNHPFNRERGADRSNEKSK